MFEAAILDYVTACWTYRMCYLELHYINSMMCGRFSLQWRHVIQNGSLEHSDLRRILSANFVNNFRLNVVLIYSNTSRKYIMKKYIFFSQIKVQLIRNKIECVAYLFDTGVTFTSKKKWRPISARECSKNSWCHVSKIQKYRDNGKII